MPTGRRRQQDPPLRRPLARADQRHHLRRERRCPARAPAAGPRGRPGPRPVAVRGRPGRGSHRDDGRVGGLGAGDPRPPPSRTSPSTPATRRPSSGWPTSPRAVRVGSCADRPAQTTDPVNFSPGPWPGGSGMTDASRNAAAATSTRRAAGRRAGCPARGRRRRPACQRRDQAPGLVEVEVVLGVVALGEAALPRPRSSCGWRPW